MTDKPTAPGKPAATPQLLAVRQHHLDLVMRAMTPPRGLVGRVQARERPGALPMPATRTVSALTPSSVIERWSDEAAGVRPAALASGDAVITMFDDVGEGFWTPGITARGVAAQLRAIGDRPVEVQINSPGGDMFEGIAIYNVLREHPQPITIKVLGMAASAASIIAMAADTLQIGAASFLMIHNSRKAAQAWGKISNYKGLTPIKAARCVPGPFPAVPPQIRLKQRVTRRCRLLDCAWSYA